MGTERNKRKKKKFS